MFLATGTTGLPSNHGVNLLYSSADFKSWRREHSLFNVSGGLLSCPEFYRLSNMPAGQYVYEHMAERQRVRCGGRRLSRDGALGPG